MEVFNMLWGINLKNYICRDAICKHYGNKTCPCVADKKIRKSYDKRNGYWATGESLPECENCACFETPLDDYQIETPSFKWTLVEKQLWRTNYKMKTEPKREFERQKKLAKATPVKVQLLNVSGGNVSERAAKMIIGGYILGDIGAFIGLLGHNKSNVTLIFNVTYADNHSEIVVEKANSAKAMKLLNMAKAD